MDLNGHQFFFKAEQIWYFSLTFILFWDPRKEDALNIWFPVRKADPTKVWLVMVPRTRTVLHTCIDKHLLWYRSVQHVSYNLVFTDIYVSARDSMKASSKEATYIMSSAFVNWKQLLIISIFTVNQRELRSAVFFWGPPSHHLWGLPYSSLLWNVFNENTKVSQSFICGWTPSVN